MTAQQSPFNREIADDALTTRDTLLIAFDQTNRAVTALWQRLGPDDFFTLPPDSGWSPAGNLVHLVGAVKPVTLALRLPRFIPRLLFGVPRTPSRTFVELREVYLAKLRQGATAGRFAAAAPPAPC